APLHNGYTASCLVLRIADVVVPRPSFSWMYFLTWPFSDDHDRYIHTERSFPLSPLGPFLQTLLKWYPPYIIALYSEVREDNANNRKELWAYLRGFKYPHP